MVIGRSQTGGYRANNSCYFTQNGIYATGLDTQNAPDYGVILTLKAPGIDWKFQIWFKTSGGIFIRRSINTGNVFTDWVQLH